MQRVMLTVSAPGGAIDEPVWQNSVQCEERSVTIAERLGQHEWVRRKPDKERLNADRSLVNEIELAAEYAWAGLLVYFGRNQPTFSC